MIDPNVHVKVAEDLDRLHARLASANALIEELWGRVHAEEDHVGGRTASECDWPICVRVRAFLSSR